MHNAHHQTDPIPSWRKWLSMYRSVRCRLRQLQTHPIDGVAGLVHAFKFRWRSVVAAGVNILEREGVHAARDYFQSLHADHALAPFQYYAALYSFLADEIDAAPTSEDDESVRESSVGSRCNKYLIHVPVWGERAGEILLKYMLPSLLAPGNLAAAACDRQVELLIHCNQQLAERIRRDPVCTHLKNHCVLSIRPFPEALHQLLQTLPRDPVNAPKYHLYGGLQALAANHAARRRTLVSFLNADFVLTRTALTQALRHVDAGKLAVVATSFRSFLPRIAPELEQYRSTDTLDLPEEAAVQLQCRYLHPAARVRIVSEKTEHFCLTPQLLFSDRRGIVVRAHDFHPLLVDGRALANQGPTTYQTADSHLLATLLRDQPAFEDRVHVVEDPCEMGFLELSEGNAEHVPQRLFPRLTPRQLRGLLDPHLRRIEKVPFHSFLFSKRVVFPARPGDQEPAADVAFLRKMGRHVDEEQGVRGA